MELAILISKVAFQLIGMISILVFCFLVFILSFDKHLRVGWIASIDLDKLTKLERSSPELQKYLGGLGKQGRVILTQSAFDLGLYNTFYDVTADFQEQYNQNKAEMEPKKLKFKFFIDLFSDQVCFGFIDENKLSKAESKYCSRQEFIKNYTTDNLVFIHPEFLATQNSKRIFDFTDEFKVFSQKQKNRIEGELT